jgi:cell wall-associated NlpC family hydrolase
MSAALDRRRNPIRDDLAAVRFRGAVDAPRYAEGEVFHVAEGRATMWGTPDTGTAPVSEVRFGEGFTVYEHRGEWAWGQNETDGYVGWIHADVLAEGPASKPTHVVADLRAFRFSGPSLKLPPEDALSLGTQVAVEGEERGYARLSSGGWVYARHLKPLGWTEPDPVATAERLLGTPYLWGGRSPWGCDCSGLTQLALDCAGIAAPRDSDMQRGEVGTMISADGLNVTFRRGDLVFFPGHVGLMRDERTLIHATAFTMTVTLEPVEDVALRAAGISAVRRLGA